jgi:hypothetical protein
MLILNIDGVDRPFAEQNQGMANITNPKTQIAMLLYVIRVYGKCI